MTQPMPTFDPSTGPVNTDGRSDAEIHAAIENKIQEAIASAVANGNVDETGKIGVVVGTDGSIQVINVDDADAEDSTATPSTPDEIELPPMFREDRESLTDSHYAKHLETHWGF